jgi:hypothetical protein
LVGALASDRLVFSVSEAEQLLSLSRAFANELVARGEPLVVCVGHRIVVPKVALLELLEATSLSTADPSCIAGVGAFSIGKLVAGAEEYDPSILKR